MTENISAIPEPDVSKENPVSEHWIWTGDHRPAVPRALVEHMTKNWGDRRTVATTCTRRPGLRRSGERASPRSSRVARSSSRPATSRCAPTTPTTDSAPAPTSSISTGCDEPDAVLVIAPGTDGPRFDALHRRIAAISARTSSSPTAATASCGSERVAASTEAAIVLRHRHRPARVTRVGAR